MKSNYKRLGRYIQEVDIRNSSQSIDLLLGVSIEKKFIPSIANTVGTDMSTYKIIRNNQFAYGPVTSRNGNKISIALLEYYNEAIISQAYTCFEICNKDELDPHYLMMWFSRPEFDRYARYMSHGSAREIFSWEELCNVTLPVPLIDIQREIVFEHNAVQNRIKLYNQLIEKLEATTLALYKHWFVDFEFPDKNGNPYKSSGGAMVESEFGEIPTGWHIKKIKEFANKVRSGGTPSRDEERFWNKNEIPWLKTGEVANKVLINAEEHITFEGSQFSSAKILPINTVLIAMYGEGKTKGQSGYLRIQAAVNQACCAIICSNESQSSYLYYFLRYNQRKIASLANGGAQPNLSKELIEEITIIEPEDSILKKNVFISFINYCEILERSNLKLMSLTSLLLSKLAALETVTPELVVA